MQLTIHTKHRYYTKVYLASVQVERGRLGLAEGAWLWQLLVERAVASVHEPIHRTTTDMVRRTLELMSDDASWRAFANRPLNGLTLEAIMVHFERLEQRLSREPASEYLKHRMSITTRGWIAAFLKQRGIARIQRLVRFRTKLTASHRWPRQLISDFAATDKDGRHVHPVAAMPHTDVSDLKARIKSRLALDLRLIEDACAKELEAARRLQDHIDGRSSQVVDPGLLRAIEAATRVYWSVPNDSIATASLTDLEGCYAHILLRDFAMAVQDRPKRYLRRSAEIGRLVAARVGLAHPEKNFSNLVVASLVGDFMAAVACLACIQIHTHWNASSVLELTTSNVKLSANRIEIQGFKSRTEDLTPIVVIDREHGTAFRAVEFLLDRLCTMKAMGWVAPSEVRLWISSLGAKDGRPHPYVGWNKILKFFQTIHELPCFSFEQLRVQSLALEAVGPGGLEAARHTAGHARLRTTAHYLDQLILHRLNSSINFEFQVRLAQSVEFRVGENALGTAERDLLYPIGDGASCIDPHNPPRPHLLEEGLCAAKRCHQDGGCAHRRIVLDADRVEELARTSAFYEGHWRRLLQENEDAFREYHFPAFMFNIALMGIVERSPYRHIVRDIKNRVHAEVTGG